jgi:hypothetical protein
MTSSTCCKTTVVLSFLNCINNYHLKLPKCYHFYGPSKYSTSTLYETTTRAVLLAVWEFMVHHSNSWRMHADSTRTLMLPVKHHWFINHCHVHPLLIHADSFLPTNQTIYEITARTVTSKCKILYWGKGLAWCTSSSGACWFYSCQQKLWNNHRKELHCITV